MPHIVFFFVNRRLIDCHETHDSDVPHIFFQEGVNAVTEINKIIPIFGPPIMIKNDVM